MSIQSVSSTLYSYDTTNIFKNLSSSNGFDASSLLATKTDTKPEGPPPGPPPGEGSSSEDMQTAIDNLQTTNPELAEKLQNIDDRMEELRESGVSPEEARKTIESEFGKPTDAEMQEIDAAMGKTSSSQGTASTTGSSTTSDLSNYLSDQSSNSSILQFLSERLGELSQLASQWSQQAAS
jgi:chromosome segregation ATPase